LNLIKGLINHSVHYICMVLLCEITALSRVKHRDA
jgi:hypothetical protein